MQKKKQINFSACQHFEEKVLNPILKSDKYRITNVLVFFQTIKKLLGHHFTWLHNECCVRFSKLKFRPSAGFSAWFRDHTGSGGPGFRTKGATACATFALPLSYLWQELLPFSAQQMPLHCTQITVQGTVGRGSEENIYIGANLKTLYALVFFALELWQGSWVHYSLYIKQGLQLSLEFQNTKSNPPFPPLCSFFLMHCTHVCCTCVWKFSLHVLTFVLSIEITTFFLTNMSLLQFHRSQFFTLPISDPPSSCNQFHHHQRFINALSSLCSLLPTFSSPFMDLCTN